MGYLVLESADTSSPRDREPTAAEESTHKPQFFDRNQGDHGTTGTRLRWTAHLAANRGMPGPGSCSCSTACCRMPAARWAPSPAAVAASSWLLPALPPRRPTPYVFSFKPGLDLDQLAADLRGSGLTMSGHVLAVRRVINVAG
jgi:hypothetical protein